MDETGPYSVHGGTLPFDERWIRREAQARLFGAAAPLRLGRYEVRTRLGAGGMGTVYAAWDPELERDVAIKILHAREPQAAQRLRREARALAALAHPNVVMIFEVGQSEGVLFIVMEHVDGQTLRAWQGEHAPKEVLAAYVQAGQGLAAAHEAGLVHGDFKPDNVLVHRDGRVRVADFGLAAWGPEHPLAGEAAATLPEAGGGTPGYRAPELDQDRPPDAHSDQFAFCVSLHEGLTGRLCDRPEALRDLPVSRRVRDAIARGLDPDPNRRFPSIHALLQAFDRPRRRWVLAPVAVLGSAAALVFSRAPDCDDITPRPWAEARTLAQVQFETAAPQWVADTWPGVDQALRVHEAALAQTQTDACLVAPGRAPALARNARACLEAGWTELADLSAALAEGEPDALATAALRVHRTLPARACRDEAALQRFDLAPADGLRERLIAALLAYERLPGQSPAYAASVVEAGLQRGGALEGLARRVRAQDALERSAHQEAANDLQIAAALAEAHGDDNARVHALATLAFAIGQDTRRLVEAERVAAQALSALESGGSPDPISEAKILHDLASVAAHARPPDLENAIRMHEGAAGTLGDALGPGHPLTVRARLSLGTALTRARRIEEALETLTAVDTQVQVLWDPSTRTWLRSRRALGLALLANDDPVAALEALSEARAARASTHRPEPLEMARDAYNVGLALRDLDRLAEAREALEDGFALVETALGADHPELTPWTALLGHTALAQGRTNDAARWFERGLELCELDGAAPKEFAKLRVGLAESLEASDAAKARVHLDAALRFLDATEGFDGLRARAKALDERLRAPAPPRTGARPPSR